jgi:SAM-dependent methyltransferase
VVRRARARRPRLCTGATQGRLSALTVADATALPFAGATFDAVSIGFGVLHFAEPERVFTEVRRVLPPGGIFGFTVWADPSAPNVAYDIMLEAVAAHAAPASIPQGPPFFRFAQARECRSALSAAGFDAASMRLEILQLTWDLPAPDGVFDAFREGTARNAGALELQPPDRLERVRQAVADATARFRSGDRLLVPVAAALVSCAAS